MKQRGIFPETIKKLLKMKTLEILKLRKSEIISATLELLSTALSGDPANRTFYFELDEDGEIKVDYHYYLGNISLDDSCFYTIRDIETPDPEEYGYEDIQDMDFAELGYEGQIEAAIDNHILEIENK